MQAFSAFLYHSVYSIRSSSVRVNPLRPFGPSHPALYSVCASFLMLLLLLTIVSSSSLFLLLSQAILFIRAFPTSQRQVGHL